MVAPEEAAILVGVNPRSVYRWFDAEMIHYLGDIRWCADDLPRFSGGPFN
jgi:hypothetical protein